VANNKKIRNSEWGRKRHGAESIGLKIEDREKVGD
jgi:hypothetical protein